MTSLENPDERMLREQLSAVKADAYSKIHMIKEWPQEVGLQVLRVLLEQACQAQNAGHIVLARRTLTRIPPYWLQKALPETIDSCLDLEDEWQFRRLIEVLATLDPSLSHQYLQAGLDSPDPEIRSAARELSAGSALSFDPT